MLVDGGGGWLSLTTDDDANGRRMNDNINKVKPTWNVCVSSKRCHHSSSLCWWCKLETKQNDKCWLGTTLQRFLKYFFLKNFHCFIYYLFVKIKGLALDMLQFYDLITSCPDHLHRTQIYWVVILQYRCHSIFKVCSELINRPNIYLSKGSTIWVHSTLLVINL